MSIGLRVVFYDPNDVSPVPRHDTEIDYIKLSESWSRLSLL